MNTARRRGAVLRRWYWRPGLLAGVASGSIMALELVVGRIAAAYVGHSLYSWTAIISIVMLGISLGSWLGGRIADRWATQRALAWMLVLGGLFSMSILLVDYFEAATQIEQLTWENPGYVARLASLGILLAFVPCLVLGCVSPMIVRLAMPAASDAGRVVGRIHALETAGSIAATFATGFWLISALGTRPLAWGIGLLLVTIGILLLSEGRWWAMLAVALTLAGCTWYGASRGWMEGSCALESDYYCIKVQDELRGKETLRVLILDRLVHSYSSLEDPERLEYEYERHYAGATAYQAQRTEDLSALFIGGGGYTFPRYMEARYPESTLHVIEIDPLVTETAYQVLGLSRDTEIVSYNEDARLFLDREPNRQYSLVFGDAFNDFSVPYHLTTHEFNQRVHSWLADDGLYVVNLIDGPRGDFLRAYIRTLRQTWAFVYPVMEHGDWGAASRNTFVLIASDQPLDPIHVAEASFRLAEQLWMRDETDVLLSQGAPLVLTDRFAPVDQMLLPVFVDILP